MYCGNWRSLAFPILAAPGVKIVPTAAGVVISQTAQVYQPHIIVQPAVQVIYVYILGNMFCNSVGTLLSQYFNVGCNRLKITLH